MKPPIEFFVPGIPKGQPRPRAFAFHGRARVYDPGTAEAWKSEIAVAARPHIPAEPWQGPLYVNLTFHMPRPKSHFNKAGMKPGAPLYFTSKPDADNLAKAVMDALTTLRFWGDDAQVVKLHVQKYYVGDAVGADVVIKEVGC
jgi:Holliday junction resolvase RusA-like endonuclease